MNPLGDLEEYKSANPEKKISVLRMEMIPLLATIRTYTDAIRTSTDANSETIELYTDKIIEAMNNLEKLRGILI